MSFLKFCRDKHVFVVTKHVFCRDEIMLVATNMIFVAAAANESIYASVQLLWVYPDLREP